MWHFNWCINLVQKKAYMVDVGVYEFSDKWIFSISTEFDLVVELQNRKTWFRFKTFDWPLSSVHVRPHHSIKSPRLEFLSKSQETFLTEKSWRFHLIYSLNLHLNKVTATWTTSKRVPLCRQDNKLSHCFFFRQFHHVTCVRRSANVA